MTKESKTICGKTREGPGALLCSHEPGHTGLCSWEALTSNQQSDLDRLQRIREILAEHDKGSGRTVDVLLALRYALRLSDETNGWQPIETAPKVYRPPLSQYNHHAPEILGLYGKSWYCVCSWGGPSAPYWIDGNNKKIAFQPTHWMPLPAAPGSPLEPSPPQKRVSYNSNGDAYLVEATPEKASGSGDST